MISPKKIPVGLLIIGLMKLITAILLCAASFGAFKLLNRDIADTLNKLMMFIHLNPENHFVNLTIEKVAGLDHHQLKTISALTLIYSGLYALEGIGLLMGKHWAEYLVIIITGSLLPLELYEIVEKTTALRFAVLAINVTVIIYLIQRLRRDKKAHKASSLG